MKLVGFYRSSTLQLTPSQPLHHIPSTYQGQKDDEATVEKHQQGTGTTPQQSGLLQRLEHVAIH